jgi:homoserine O-succinyltransferase
MFLVFNRAQYGDVGAGNDAREVIGHKGENGDASEYINIGLVNNMPDAALRATESQFINLLAEAAGERNLHLYLFTLPEIPRGDTEQQHVRAMYTDIRRIGAIDLDALIVTGCEPRANRLEDEPYWKSLAAVVDWAEHNTVSTIWSCLAAHGAVLHLDGVERHRLGQKCSGVFDCEIVDDSPLLSSIRTPLCVSHSRWNELRERDLISHGYHVLTWSPVAGIDVFVKRWRSLFVFFQGHPEYSGDTLMREYRRDVGRFLLGESPCYPATPVDYFDEEAEAVLAGFEAAAVSDPDPRLLESFPPAADLRAHVLCRSSSSGAPLMSNWLSYIAARKRELSR